MKDGVRGQGGLNKVVCVALSHPAGRGGRERMEGRCRREAGPEAESLRARVGKPGLCCPCLGQGTTLWSGEQLYFALLCAFDLFETWPEGDMRIALSLSWAGKRACQIQVGDWGLLVRSFVLLVNQCCSNGISPCSDSCTLELPPGSRICRPEPCP